MIDILFKEPLKCHSPLRQVNVQFQLFFSFNRKVRTFSDIQTLLVFITSLGKKQPLISVIEEEAGSSQPISANVKGNPNWVAFVYLSECLLFFL